MAERDFGGRDLVQENIHVHEMELRKRVAFGKQALRSPIHTRKVHIGVHKKIQKNKRAQWSNEALTLAIKALNEGYKMSEVCKKYKISRSSLRDHVVGRTKGRKMGPKTILSQKEEQNYVSTLASW